ncbi:PspA/IM30 family protein [Georgenia sp. Z1491]|uniref:PspA/IM30 family protein n=1 Tax=Georgenia sp. Z1491 TaxID=3416707 RepID=UPI003CE8062F
MGVGRRIFGIGRAEGNDRRRRRREAKNPPPDPATEIAEAVRRQRAAVDDARRAVGELTVQRRRTELLHERAELEVEGHERAAAIAVEQGDDAAARAALGRALEAAAPRDRLADQLAVLRNKEEDLRAGVGRLEAQVHEVESRRRALAADREAARASATIAQAMRTDVPGSTAEAVRAAEREVHELEGRQAAYEELAWTDSGSHQVHDAFDRLGREARIEAELRRLHGWDHGGDRSGDHGSDHGPGHGRDRGGQRGGGPGEIGRGPA